MQKSKKLYRLVALFVVFISLSAFVGDFDDEKDLIKTADKHFEAEEYAEALDLYSTLVSNHAQDPNYNYKYGACKLFATEDKIDALRYLSFATQSDKVDPQAFYFYGKALQMNYEFDKAAIQFKKFKLLVKEKEYRDLHIDHLINQCKIAQKMIYDFKKMDVVNKKSVGKQEFFRSYRLGSMKRNIIVTPEEFLSSADKKSKDYSLIVHNPINEVIYFSSYNKDGNIGGKDIFKIIKMPDGTFSKPVNLGPTVNTSMDEDYPYLHPNGRVLYFASKGRNGIGGYDIFRSELDTVTNIWGLAQNVGFSINSPADDILYVSDMDENIAYFASNRGDKQGKITVYKILPNKSDEPIVIVRGQVEVEGSRNHTAKVTVYNSDGEELAVYNSKSSGTFIMTLDEDQTYTIGVSAPGKGEAKSSLEVPAKSEWDMISKKFVVGANKLTVKDGDELLATAAEKSKILRESALLEVNQEKDVDFNTKIDRPKSSPKTVEENVTDDLTQINEPSSESEDLSTEDNILASAEKELEEVKASREKVQKQIDATYHVANKKKIKTQLLKDDIENISEELESAFTEEEKNELQQKLNKKRTELKANAASATAALELAKAKERELVVKEKQEKLAQTYVDAVKKANSSNNSSKAIADLEKARDELDKIQEEIKRVKENDGTAETVAKADAARKKMADLELKQLTLDKDVKDIEQQKASLELQIKSTKNKGLKEEYGLQIKELDEELAEIKVESNVNQAKLDEAKSEYEVLSSTQNVYDEIYTEADDEALVAISEAQKQTIQNEVSSQNKSVNEVLKEEKAPAKNENTVANIQEEYAKLDEKAKVSPEQQYADEVAKANLEKESLKAIRDEIELLELAAAGETEKRQKQELEGKIAQLREDEKSAVENLRKYVDSAKEQEKDLPAEAVSASKEEVALLAELEKETVSYEQEVNAEEPRTEPLTFDVETASESEVNQLLSDNSGIRKRDVQSKNLDKEGEKLISSIEELQKAAVKDLIEANKAQVDFESNGGKGESPKAVKLKKNALEKQFEIAKVEGQVNEKNYTAKRDELEKEMFSTPGMATEDIKSKAKEVSDRWISASVRREQANKEQNEADKIRLINEASELEQEAIELQGELAQAISNKKEEIIASKDSEVKDEPVQNEELTVVEEQPQNEISETSEEATPVNQQIETTAETLTEKEIEQTIEEPNEVVKTTGQTKSISEGEVQTVSPEDFNKEAPSKAAVHYGNKEGYGIERETDYKYSGSEAVSKVQEQAQAYENEALDYFYQAEALKQQFAQNPEVANKLEKEAEKLLKKGQKAQDKANNQYAKLNKEELAFNKKEVEFAIEYNEIQKKDSAKIILKQADELFADAQEIRKEASKSKSPDKKADLINEAYEMEMEAIKKQNYVLSGELDGEVSDISEELLVVIPEREDNEYTRKADALRAQADNEEDPIKQRQLFEEARMYELAGNKDRTQRMLDNLNADKATFENNTQIVLTSREQSNNNTPANKAWKYEQEADSLFKIADEIRRKADVNTNEVERLKQITSSKEIMAEAKEKQASAIMKYQESKSAPDEPNFVADFRKEEVEEELAKKDEEVKTETEEPAINNTTKEDDLLAVNNEPVTGASSIEEQITNEEVGAPQEQEEVSDDVIKDEIVEESTVQENPTTEIAIEEPQEDIAVNEITPQVEEIAPERQEQTEETPQVEMEEPKEQQVTVLQPEKSDDQSAEESYKALIAEAEKSEAQEVERVDRIVHLKNQAGINRNKSEELLAQVDGLSDESEIMKKINEANKYRALAEEQSVEAQNQELILKNNVAEARAKKKEADMILAAIDESKQAEVEEAAKSNNEDLKKVRDFLDNGEKVETPVVVQTEPKEVTPVSTPVTPAGVDEVEKEEVVQVDEPQAVSSEFKNSEINMASIRLLDEGSTENSVDDEFTMNPSQVYSSSSVIPVDPEMPKGIIYQVQVGAFRQKINPSIFNGLSPLVGEDAGNGITRYKVGYFRGFKSANMAKGRIRKLGYPDAFVVVFYDGKRISLDKAQEVISAADESEKFVYENLVQDEVQKLKSLGINENEAFEEPAPVNSSPSVVINQANRELLSQENGLNNDLLSIGGTFFTVQVGVFSSPRISSDLNGVTPLYTEKTSNGYLRYTTGVYRDFGSADQRKDQVRNQGIKDAFVTAYRDNNRISAAQAREELGSDNNASANSGSNKQGDSSSDNAEVVFKVQVGAYRAPITVETTPVFKDLTDYEISSIETSNGLLIYMVGNYNTKAEADNLRQIVVNSGGKDCFVVALVNGKRIPMSQALQMVK